MVVVSVIALLLALVAVMAALRAWSRGRGDKARRHLRSSPSAETLAKAVVVIALLDIVAGAALGFSLVHIGGSANGAGASARQHHSQHTTTTASPASAPRTTAPTTASPTSAPATTEPPTSAPATTAPATTAPATTAPTTTAPTTTLPTTTAAPTTQKPGPKPVLNGISPASGVAGEVVTLSGTGLFSADGVISVSFGGVQAPVACPTQTTCRATVPPGPTAKSHRTVEVTLVTQAGTSNQVTFTYG